MPSKVYRDAAALGRRHAWAGQRSAVDWSRTSGWSLTGVELPEGAGIDAWCFSYSQGYAAHKRERGKAVGFGEV